MVAVISVSPQQKPSVCDNGHRLIKVNDNNDGTNIFKNYFVFLVAPGLHCCTLTFSICGEQGLLFAAVWASHCGGFSRFGAQAL